MTEPVFVFGSTGNSRPAVYVGRMYDFSAPSDRPSSNSLSAMGSVPTHILVVETIERFGVDPRWLKSNSERTVLMTCASCGGISEKPFRRALKQRSCLKCSNAKNARSSSFLRSQRMRDFYANGGKHPLAGVGHSEKTRAKISAIRSGRPLKLSDEGRAKLAEHCRRTLHTEEVKARTKEAASIKLRGSGNGSYGRAPTHTKKIWHERRDGVRICFRSSWEGRFACWLDDLGINWEYEPKAFPILYLYDGKIVDGTYTPDFYVDGEWFEIKGLWTPIGRLKFDAFVRMYPQFPISVLDRSSLKQAGIL